MAAPSAPTITAIKPGATPRSIYIQFTGVTGAVKYTAYMDGVLTAVASDAYSSKHEEVGPASGAVALHVPEGVIPDGWPAVGVVVTATNVGDEESVDSTEDTYAFNA